MNKIRKRVYHILISSPSADLISRIINLFIIILILLSVGFTILETSREIQEHNAWFFDTFEILVVIIFSVEYMIRIWACVEDPSVTSSTIGRVKFALKPLLIIDLMAILPFYLPLFFPVDLLVLRMLRLLRILRIFKLVRYHSAMSTIGRVLYKTKEELVVTLFAGFILLIVASTLLYFVEYPVQPEVFSSIPATMWCVIATLTTVGYGDIFPITVLGKCIATTIAVLGVGMFALPAGILGSAFLEDFAQHETVHQCPKCKHKY